MWRERSAQKRLAVPARNSSEHRASVRIGCNAHTEWHTAQTGPAQHAATRTKIKRLSALHPDADPLTQRGGRRVQGVLCIM